MKKNKVIKILIIIALACLWICLPNISEAKNDTNNVKKEINIMANTKKQLMTKDYNNYEWTTSNKKIATISKKSVIKAKKEGKVKIIRKDKKTGKKKTYKIKVTSDVESKKAINLIINDKKQLMKKNYKNYKWTTSDSKIATVTKKSIVTTKKEGKVKITGTNKKTGKKKIYNLTIKNNLRSLKISVVPQKHWVGGSYKITVSKLPANSKETVYFSSSNSNVASVVNGNIIMKSQGKATITAYTKESNLKSSINVTVYNTPELSFEENTQISLEIKDSKQLKLNCGDYPTSNIKYKNNHPEIIKLENTGKITALRPGSAVITATALDGKSATIKVLAVSTKGLITTKTLDNYNANNYKNVMIVAHPDDEILWGGANLYNDGYFVVCLTNGYDRTRANDYRNILKFTQNSGIILNYPDVQDGIRDEWENVKEGVQHDLVTILSYKDWDKVVTYGPDGTTGHIHHKKTCQHVTEAAIKCNEYNNLYYFGKFYGKNAIPYGLNRISDEDLEHKKQEVEIYTNVRNNIYNFWYHMLPYENWVLASEWHE